MANKAVLVGSKAHTDLAMASLFAMGFKAEEIEVYNDASASTMVQIFRDMLDGAENGGKFYFHYNGPGVQGLDAVRYNEMAPDH